VLAFSDEVRIIAIGCLLWIVYRLGNDLTLYLAVGRELETF
jgi:hypothetical protein